MEVPVRHSWTTSVGGRTSFIGAGAYVGGPKGMRHINRDAGAPQYYHLRFDGYGPSTYFGVSMIEGLTAQFPDGL